MNINKINLPRRTVIKSLGAAVGVAAATSIVGCSENNNASVNNGATEPLGIVGSDGKRVLPWSNWSGNQKSQPTKRLVPKSEQQLVDLVKKSDQTIRFVGSGHSFSALVPTEDTLISLARMRGVTDINSNTMEADIAAGTLLGQIGKPLWEKGLALTNMPDIDTQALAGALATSTHGTGKEFGSLSSDVTNLRIVTASGDIAQCNANQNSELFNAARNNLGCLGAITSARMKVRPAYKLKERTWIAPKEELIESATEMAKSNRNFEIFPIPHSDYAAGLTLNEVPLTSENTVLNEAETENPLATLRSLSDWTDNLPWLRTFLLNRAISNSPHAERTDRSYKIFGNVRDVKFNEMEYSIPAESGPKCLREILDVIERHNLEVIFPLEYRYVKADDIWLSPFYQRDSCTISCHEFHDKSFKKYFAALEPIFLKYDGRPHWGKIHSLSAPEMAARYPMFNEFKRIRKEYDPDGLFLNSHIRQVLGVS